MKILPSAAVFATLCQFAQAVILFGAGNEANIDDPDTGLPFDSVARVSSTAGFQDGGSGVYLGNGFMLTAAHIADPQLNTVTFNNSTFYSRDLSYVPQRIGDTDLKIFKLSINPTVEAVAIYDGTAELLNEGYLVGWGRGRAAGEPLESGAVQFAPGGSPLIKRWGTNDPNRTISSFSYTSPLFVTYTFDALETTLGDSGGDFEAAATTRDSGSGFFQNIGGTWYLTGLTSAILQQEAAHATFGDDLPWSGTTPSEYSAPLGTGDPNVFVRVSSYSSEIYALVPEPSVLLLSVASIGLLLRRRR
jgi:hypothetical protein